MKNYPPDQGTPKSVYLTETIICSVILAAFLGGLIFSEATRTSLFIAFWVAGTVACWFVQSEFENDEKIISKRDDQIAELEKLKK